ncbi:hypothetical protein D6C89_07601 [Aureobasidium pullulans]|nr:hypothetical protein D6C89_07601 [Aureobasidium pullulans]
MALTPIAIISISCRFAGDATSPEKFEVLASKFNLKGVYHPNGERAETTNVIGRHFLKDDVAGFDAAFFGFLADLASLEGTYKALESDAQLRDPLTLPCQQMLSVSAAMAANRLSHFFDLRGPSMAIDTGCSTTLTALH